MSWYKNVSIRGKVVIAFATVLIVTALLGVFAVDRVAVVNANAEILSSDYLVAAFNLGEIDFNSSHYREAQAEYLLAASPEGRAKAAADMSEAKKSVVEAWEKYAPTIGRGKEREIADQVIPAWNAYITLNEKFVALVDGNRSDEARALFVGAMRDGMLQFKSPLQADQDYQLDAGQKQSRAGADTYAHTRIFIFAGVGLAIMLSAIAGWLIVSGVSTPIRAMTSVMARLAQHDMSADILGVERKDEVGQMANAVQFFKNSMIEADRLKAEQEAAEKAAAARSALVDQLTREFDTSVQGVVQSVARQASQMQSAAASMSASAEEATKQAAAVAAASEEGAVNVQTVASAAEELSSSIAEIGRQVGHSSQIAGTAVREAAQANDMIQGLASASAKIGEIVALINDIADQTNLLALNATIEAARAGEAGKGFAVVAAEVKNLATQTSKATEEIGGQISSVQGATQNAVSAIASIGKTIGEINHVATTITAAVEQQGAATQEIARNVEQAAKGTQEVSANIGGVTEAANSTGLVANQVLTSARALSAQSGELRTLVNGFLTRVKAA